MSEHLNISAPDGTNDFLQKNGISPSKLFQTAIKNLDKTRNETGEIESREELKEKILKLSGLIQHLTRRNEELAIKINNLGGKL